MLIWFIRIYGLRMFYPDSLPASACVRARVQHVCLSANERICVTHARAYAYTRVHARA
jgi:hypothetical protein